MNYKDFLQKLPDKKAVIKYFVRLKYPDGVKCPRCKSEEVKERKDNPKELLKLEL